MSSCSRVLPTMRRAWGGQFDYNDYEGVLPKVVKGPISGVADLEKITVLPGDQVCLQSRSRSFRR